MNMKRFIILSSIFIVMFGISKTSCLGEELNAVKKLRQVTIELSKELGSQEAIFDKAKKQKNFKKTVDLLLLQKTTNHALSIIYDSIAFLELYNNLDFNCKTQAAKIIENRLLYSRDILNNTIKEISFWQTSFSKEGDTDMSECCMRILEPMRRAENTLNNITHFMKQ